ncbi:MAG: glycosyltransferase family 4 protein [Zoogloeaceae bacterium]|jgi:UDP-glucose:(heptosyl)LPS alpha-1,3-glucosyltransferase|nr:glycosyltransferase family 4 protein [Zoogloeaceae bacterium]
MVTLAFVLYKYFPFGGLQRDFLRIALSCQRRGVRVRVYALSWQGDLPAGFDLRMPPPDTVRALANHRRYEKFHAWLSADLAGDPAARVIGFNKMSGLDVYYAADPCYEEKARTARNPLYRLLPRYRYFAAAERAVFGPEAGTRVLMISAAQKPVFQRHYGTPDTRFHLLPPGVDRDRRRPDEAEAAAIRADFRREFGLSAEDLLLVQIGSGFKTKGLDRALQAIKALPSDLRSRTRLIAIGQDAPLPFLRLGKRLGLSGQFSILAGRDDIPRFLLGADLLIHPAYHENTGTVLLEALLAGLPVLTTGVCGYAHYISAAKAGRVLPEPFLQADLNRALEELLTSPDERLRATEHALEYARTAELHALPEKAADLILEGL